MFKINKVKRQIKNQIGISPRRHSINDIEWIWIIFTASSIILEDYPGDKIQLIKIAIEHNGTGDINDIIKLLLKYKKKNFLGKTFSNSGENMTKK